MENNHEFLRLAERLQVVPPRLLLAAVGVDAHVPHGASEALLLRVGDVVARVGVHVLLGQSEVHQVDDVGLALAAATDAAVLRLDVPIDDAVRVDVFHAIQELRWLAKVVVGPL